MALAFPLSLADFFGGLRVQECSFRLLGTAIQSRTRGGEVLTAEIGNRLWQARVALRPLVHREASAALARLELLEGTGASLMIMPWPMCGPAYDRDGSRIAGYSPFISAILANRRELRINGLSPLYQISPGDFLAFSYGGGSPRHAIHRVVVGRTANVNGNLAQAIEVVPHIRPGAAVNDPVTLFRPTMKAVIEPGSVSDGQMRGNRRYDIGFTVIQTLG